MGNGSERKFSIRQLEVKTLTWWNNRRKQIDMNPPYQRRGRLWSDTDKAYLIDSIINEYDIPKLYFADFTLGDSDLNKLKLSYAIIDGKQRLEAIFDFFDGKIVLNEDFVYIRDTKLKLEKLGYRDLKANHAEIAEIFDNYNLSVIGVYARSEEPISELFVRLNRSKPLTGAEIRNAMSGPAPKVIRKISKHDFFMTNVRFSVTRGQDLNAVAKFLLFEFERGFCETKRRNLDNLVNVAKKKPNSLELVGRRVLDVLDSMGEIFLPRDKLLSSGGILPVYYWFIRSRKEDDYPLIRKFLSHFETQRKKNRKLLAAVPGSGKANDELIEYDNFSRSTNDLQSHEGRFKILKRRFERFR